MVSTAVVSITPTCSQARQTAFSEVFVSILPTRLLQTSPFDIKFLVPYSGMMMQRFLSFRNDLGRICKRRCKIIYEHFYFVILEAFVVEKWVVVIPSFFLY